MTRKDMLDNKKPPPIEGGHSHQNGGMWTLKHDTFSPNLYKILLKTEMKGENDIDLKNFYNHVRMCINTVKKLR